MTTTSTQQCAWERDSLEAWKYGRQFGIQNQRGKERTETCKLKTYKIKKL